MDTFQELKSRILCGVHEKVVRTDKRKFFFTQRVIKMWKSLQEDVGTLLASLLGGSAFSVWPIIFFRSF